MVHSYPDNGLGFAFNIDPVFHNIGIAKSAFTMAYTYISAIFNVQYIEGAWLFVMSFRI